MTKLTPWESSGPHDGLQCRIYCIHPDCKRSNVVTAVNKTAYWVEQGPPNTFKTIFCDHCGRAMRINKSPLGVKTW